MEKEEFKEWIKTFGKKRLEVESGAELVDFIENAFPLLTKDQIKDVYLTEFMAYYYKEILQGVVDQDPAAENIMGLMAHAWHESANVMVNFKLSIPKKDWQSLLDILSKNEDFDGKDWLKTLHMKFTTDI